MWTLSNTVHVFLSPTWVDSANEVPNIEVITVWEGGGMRWELELAVCFNELMPSKMSGFQELSLLNK